MAHKHHRAPLMFHEESYTDWMTLLADDAQAMMTPYAGEVEFFEIGRAIGNVGNNSLLALGSEGLRHHQQLLGKVRQVNSEDDAMTLKASPRRKTLTILGAALLSDVVSLAAITAPAQPCQTNGCAQPDPSEKYVSRSRLAPHPPR